MRRPLQRPLLLLALAATCTVATPQAVGINTDGTAPHASSMLDVRNPATGTMRGLLIPRMTQAQRVAIAPAAAQDGLWVYQTDDVGAEPHGLYYWEQGTGWRRWSDGGNGWRTDGNTLATGTEYIGTNNNTSNTNLLIRTTGTTGNADMMIANTAGLGRVSLGNSTGQVVPPERLDVNGAVKVGFTGTTTNPGTIIYGTLGASQPGYVGDDRKFHYGFDGIQWRRFQNAERIVDSPLPSYATENYSCQGETGQILSAAQTGSGNNAVGNTMLPTNFVQSATIPNGYRVQYLYRASELAAAGLCAGPITSIAFNLLDPDSVGMSASTTTQISIRVRLYGAVGITPFTTGGTFNLPAQNLPQPNFALNNMIYGVGWLEFPIPSTFSGGPTVVPFSYTAGHDLIVDIQWLRNGIQGKSPRVENQTTGLPYSGSQNSTKWSRPNFAFASDLDANIATYNAPGIGATPAPNGAVNSNRPILQIKGNVQTMNYVSANAPYTLYEGSLLLGDATWADTSYRGPGVIRAQSGVYDGNTLLSDHIFDKYYDGAVQPADAASAQGVVMVGLTDLKEHLATERHLPGMPSRAEWEESGSKSLGELQTGLWQTAEMQALYIAELERDLRALETAVLGQDIAPADAQRLLEEVRTSRRLTEAQKLHLTAALQRLSATETPNRTR